MKSIKFVILCVFLVLLMASCGVNKHIPAGSYLLQKNKVEIEGNSKKAKKNITKDEINNLIIQDPNTKTLWTTKLSMRVYCLSSPKSNNWLNKFLRKIGQKPVIYNPTLSVYTAEKIQTYLANKGSFNSQINFEPLYKKRKAIIRYTVEPTEPYSIKNITFIAEDDTIQKILDRWKINSAIKQGSNYDLANLTADRDKLTTALHNMGYFGFYKENIVFEVDTTIGSRELNISLKVLNPHVYDQERDTIIKGVHKRYTVKNVYILPQYNLIDTNVLKYDTTIVSLYRQRDKIFQNYIFLHKGKMKINPKTIAQNLFIDPNSFYSIGMGDRTYTGLSNLNNFKYINISYTINNDSLQPNLDAWIHLMDNKINSFSTSLDITSTSLSGSDDKNLGNFGLEWSASYQNKNLFGNAEIFNIKYRLFGQLPKDLTQTESEKFLSYFSTFETGVNLSLDVPKFIFPLRKNMILRYFRPRTSFNVGYGYQYKPLYERSIASIGFGYKWRGSSTTEHTLFPFEFNSVNVLIKDSIFQDSVRNLRDKWLQYQYTDHLIMDMKYSFFKTTQRQGALKDFTAFLMTVESGGNLLYTINKLSNANNQNKAFGLPYAQYIRTDFDVKHYFYFNPQTILVLRGYLGLGFTYGSSQIMPYEKSFYGGGPSGVRAWQMRTLGPGAYKNTGTLFERIGDFSLCINAEQRFHIFSIFEGAAFLDMGNIWLQRQSEEFAGGEFKFDRFHNELAIGGGLGIRLNIRFAIIRFDFALPFRDPARDYGERWRFDKLQPRNLVVNLGINYPF